jgi:hypothetical protein
MTDKEEQKPTGLVLTVGKKGTKKYREYLLEPSDLGPKTDILARKHTGLPVSPFLTEGQLGADSLLVVYWLCRRLKGNEPNLRFDDVLEEFDNYEAINDAGFMLSSLEDENPEEEEEK